MKESKKVLITNDVHSSILLVSKFLDFYQQLREDVVINPLFAYSGQESINTVEKTPDLDLVIMNWEMPLMNGLQATDSIRRLRPDLPVILYSAYVDNSSYIPLIKEHFDGYIPIPIDVHSFSRVIDTYLLKK